MCICKGMGKSRIIAAIVALKNEYDGTNKFTVVFTTELLRSVESASYMRLANTLKTTINLVVYNPSMTLAS